MSEPYYRDEPYLMIKGKHMNEPTKPQRYPSEADELREQLTTALARAESAERSIARLLECIEKNGEQVQNDSYDGRFKDGHKVACDMAIAFIGAHYSAVATPTSAQIQTLETRNRQLVQAMGETALTLRGFLDDAVKYPQLKVPAMQQERVEQVLALLKTELGKK